MHMVSLSWTLRSPFSSLSLLYPSPWRGRFAQVLNSLPKSSSNPESYSYQKERSGSCPPLQFYLLKVYPAPVVMLQPHQLPSCSLNLAHFTDPQDISLAVPEPRKLFSEILITHSHPSVQSSKEAFLWKL